jgi:hypothetical protein
VAQANLAQEPYCNDCTCAGTKHIVDPYTPVYDAPSKPPSHVSTPHEHSVSPAHRNNVAQNVQIMTVQVRSSTQNRPCLSVIHRGPYNSLP